MKYILVVIIIGVLLAAGAASVVATRVNIAANGVPDTLASLNRTKFFDKTLTINKNNLHISISAKGGYVLNSILLYLCQDSDPLNCDFSAPIEYEKFVETDLRLDELSKNGKLNMLTLVNANDSWIGGWDTIENGALKTADIDNAKIYLKYNFSDQIKTVIESFGSIPSSSIASAEFDGRQFYILDGKKIAGGLFRKEKLNITGSSLESKFTQKKGYSFVFPKDNVIYNPLTFFDTPEICGNTKCDIGENYNTCWQDCSCPEGFAPTPTGCVPKTNITLEMELDKKDFECLIPPNTDAFNSVRGCGFYDGLTIKLHINNTPLNYSAGEPYFDFGGKSYPFIGRKCQEGFGEGYKITGDSYTGSTIVYNASKFTCTTILPTIDTEEAFENKKTLAVVFPITFSRGNETETQKLTAITSVNVKGTDLKVSIPDIAGMAEKARRMEKDIANIDKLSKLINIILGTIHGVSLSIDFCCGTGVGSLFCCGSVNWWHLALESLQAANYAFTDYKKSQLEDEMKNLERYRDRQIEESKEEAKSSVKQQLPNLVWVNGNSSGGYTGSVCGNEQAEVWYNFEAFGCSKGDGLWFNFNNQSRPSCDCQSSVWSGNKIEGIKCNCNSTSTDFSWVIKNQEGKDIGFKKYNSQGKHKLLSATADKLFPQSNILNITIFCAANDFGDLAVGNIKSEFEFLNYTSTCGGL